MAEKILYTAKDIDKRMGELAQTVVDHYQTPDDLLLVGILTGGVTTTLTLGQRLFVDHGWDVPMKFVPSSSYGSGQVSSRAPVVGSVEVIPRNKHLLGVEDIIDTGHTVQRLCAVLAELSPLSLQFIALLSKPARREVAVDQHVLEYGFVLEGDPWVWGYGIDRDGTHGRHDTEIKCKV